MVVCCSGCKTTQVALQTCSECMHDAYCSVPCQQKHFEIHKLTCVSSRASRIGGPMQDAGAVPKCMTLGDFVRRHPHFAPLFDMPVGAPIDDLKQELANGDTQLESLRIQLKDPAQANSSAQLQYDALIARRKTITIEIRRLEETSSVSPELHTLTSKRTKTQDTQTSIDMRNDITAVDYIALMEQLADTPTDDPKDQEDVREAALHLHALWLGDSDTNQEDTTEKIRSLRLQSEQAFWRWCSKQVRKGGAVMEYIAKQVDPNDAIASYSTDYEMISEKIKVWLAKSALPHTSDNILAASNHVITEYFLSIVAINPRNNLKRIAEIVKPIFDKIPNVSIPEIRTLLENPEIRTASQTSFGDSVIDKLVTAQTASGRLLVLLIDIRLARAWFITRGVPSTPKNIYMFVSERYTKYLQNWIANTLDTDALTVIKNKIYTLLSTANYNGLREYVTTLLLSTSNLSRPKIAGSVGWLIDNAEKLVSSLMDPEISPTLISPPPTDVKKSEFLRRFVTDIPGFPIQDMWNQFQSKPWFWAAFSEAQKEEQTNARVAFLMDANNIPFVTCEAMEALVLRNLPANNDVANRMFLFRACTLGCLSVVQNLLNRNFDPNLKDQSTLLATAIANGHTEIVRVLLDAGAVTDPDAVYSPLIAAIEEDRLDIVILLLNHGANMDERSDTNRNVLMLSFNHEINAELLARGADIHHRDDEGNTPFLHACMGPSKQSIDLFLSHGSKITEHNYDRQTGLMFAAQNEGNVPECEYLIQLGCDVNAVDIQGRNVVFYAIDSDYPPVLWAVMRHGANINITDTDGTSAVKYAAMRNHLMAKALFSGLIAGKQQIDDPPQLDGINPAANIFLQQLAAILQPGIDMDV